MSKTLYVGKGDRSGISITFTKKTGNLDISGWYDTFVGIEGESIHLKEFFTALGVTKKDCERAFHDIKTEISS